MKERISRDWADFEACKEFLQGVNFYGKNEKCFKFYAGEQWENVPEGMPTPQDNILKGIVDYKVSTVLRNGLTLNFGNAEFKDRALADFTEKICGSINSHISKVWEQNDMDANLWEIVEEACISGGAGVYSYLDDDGNIAVELKGNTDVLFADEQEKDVEKQRFIILPFRKSVAKVREEGRQNGLNDDELKLILSDEDTTFEVGGGAKREVKFDEEGDGKCRCILKMWKDEEGFVRFRKSTREVEFCREVKTRMKRYPLCFLAWNVIKGGLRGKGDVLEWIPNQIEINKNLARRAVAVMQSAYPKMAYNGDYIADPSTLMETGSVIEVEGVEDVQKMVAYLNPQMISPDAKAYVDDLKQSTQELSGANQYAMGNINPSTTSGRAILAVQDASAQTLTKQVARVKKFVEDIGRCWWDIYASEGEGVYITHEEKGTNENGEEVAVVVSELIPPKMVEKMKVNVKVDVSPTNTYSKFAVEQTLENFFLSQTISFEEYVRLLPDDSIAPKAKLLDIVQRRGEMQAIIAERDKYKADYESLANALSAYEKVGNEVLANILNNQSIAKNAERAEKPESGLDKKLPTNSSVENMVSANQKSEGENYV